METVTDDVDVELMVRDVHPAELLRGEELLRDARVFVTSRRLVAFKATSDGSIETVLDELLELPCSVPASRATLTQGRLEVRLADGQTVWINRGRGCGCGSPLKALGTPVPWTAGR